MKTKNKLIVIVGPHASGKSLLAVKLAKLFNGEVISADSRQIYKHLNIGSGKITKNEMQNIPHHLISIASPRKTFNVTQYQKLALKTIKKIWHKNKIPILCGGTGFYIKAVIDGIIFPPVKPNIKLRKQLQQKSTQELYQLLKKINKKRAQNIDKNNKVRLIRAIEITKTLGTIPPLKQKPLNANILMLGLQKNKKTLYQLAAQRLNKNFKNGLIKVK
ncbi:MAG: tRNA (adenosine(37)-N6)-dimethylallyltransferase MiaA [Minisyncoccia bacterium]